MRSVRPIGQTSGREANAEEVEARTVGQLIQEEYRGEGSGAEME